MRHSHSVARRTARGQVQFSCSRRVHVQSFQRTVAPPLKLRELRCYSTRGRRRTLLATKPCCSTSCPPPVRWQPQAEDRVRQTVVVAKSLPGACQWQCTQPGCSHQCTVQCCTVLTESLNFRARLSLMSCSTVRLHYKETP